MNNLIDGLGKKLRIDTRYIFNGGGWLMIGYIATFTTVLATAYVFANFVDPSVYGQYKYLLSVGTLIGSFSLTGIGIAVVQGVAKNVKGFYRFALIKSLKYGLIYTVIALIGSVYYSISGNSLLAIGLLIIALLNPLMDSLNLVFAYFIGAQQFKMNTKMHTVKTVVVSITLIITAFYTESVLIITTAYFTSHIICNFLVHFFSKIDFTEFDESEETIRLFSYSKHTSIQNIIMGISNQLDKVIVFQNMGAFELATYSFATALPDQYKSITKSVENLLLPRFSQQSQASVKNSILRKSIIYFLFLMLCAIFYTAIAPYLFSVLFPVYMDSVFLSQIYVWGIIFGIGGIPISALKASMDNKNLYWFNLSTSIFQILSVVILFYFLGLIGIVFARILHRAFLCSYAYYLYYRD